jgi:hypothetical protein
MINQEMAMVKNVDFFSIINLWITFFGSWILISIQVLKEVFGELYWM